MSKPFDATTKFLIDTAPADWLRLAGITLESGAVVEPLDADLSTISANADRLLRVSNIEKPCLYHIELQASNDARFDERVFWYNSLARYEFRLPVYSIAFLLRRAADGVQVKGMISETNGSHHLAFRYALVRVWQLSVDTLLTGGLATLPLAPLAAQTPDEASELVRVVHNRFDSEADIEQARELSAATFILLGLKYDKAFIETLTKGIQKMRESVTYQMILDEGREQGRDEGRDEGRIQEARENILALGTRRYGTPTDAQRTRIQSENSRTQLEIWLLSLLDATDWDSMLH